MFKKELIVTIMVIMTPSILIADENFIKIKNKGKAEEKSIPIEPDNDIADELKGRNDLIQALGKSVKLMGYKCGSISAAMPFIISKGYKLQCNNFRYSYTIKDKGGKMDINVE